jgi:hypothetical protein
MDYDMQIDLENRSEQLQKLVGIGNIQNFGFTDQAGKQFEIPDFKSRLILQQFRPVEFGSPLFGLILFMGDIKDYKADIHSFELTCIDVFGHKHKIEAIPKQFQNVSYVADLFGLKYLPSGS